MKIFSICNNEIAMKGRAPARTDPNYVNYNKEAVVYADTGCNRMRYKLLLKAVGDGIITSDTNGISVKTLRMLPCIFRQLPVLTVLINARIRTEKMKINLLTSYLYSALKKKPQMLLNNHLNDYHHYFNHISFHLAALENNINAALPTDERLIGYTDGPQDPQLENTYFNFVR